MSTPQSPVTGDEPPVVIVVGLGPIGGGVGSTLSAEGYGVVGVELNAARSAEWTATTGLPVVRSVGEAPWDRAAAAIIAVRLADQVHSVLREIPASSTPILVMSTIAISEAQAFDAYQEHRIIETPVSGGAGAAWDGTLSMFVHSTTPLTPFEAKLIGDITSDVFTFREYGLPAAAKLVNNSLAAYNAFAYGEHGRIAVALGLGADFRRVVKASSGQSWMGDHFFEFPEDLLHKDVELLARDARLSNVRPLQTDDWTSHFTALRSDLPIREDEDLDDAR